MVALPHYGQLITRFDTIAENLLELHVKEEKDHDRVWKNCGRLLKDAQKAHADSTNEVDGIVAANWS